MEKTGQLGADSLRNTLSLVRGVSRKGAELRGLAVQLLTGQGIGGLGGGGREPEGELSPSHHSTFWWLMI